MRVVVYHEVRPEVLDAVLRHGLKCDDDGEKSDQVVRRTDDCLETRKPAHLADRGVERSRAVYGYLAVGSNLVDISTGNAVDAAEFAARRDQILLRITADCADCYVSDLDAYDAVKMCVSSDAEDSLLSRLAQRYWTRVIPFEEYRPGLYRRPEVMVCNDVDGQDIEVVSADG
jgi:hypothetical protein